MKLVITFLALAISMNVFAHGMDKLGPNGGFIQMPGAFHTEVVPMSSTQIKVFLLDMNWQNPSIKNSKMQVKFKNLKARVLSSGSCKIKDNFYLCDFQKFVDINKAGGELMVDAQREGQKGKAAVYELPLKLTPATSASKVNVSPVDHKMMDHKKVQKH